MGFDREAQRRATGPGTATRSAGSTSKTFARKADAERFAREIEVDKDRGQWIDPRDADVPLAAWAETFLSLVPAAGADHAGDLPPRPRALHPARGSAPTGSAGCPPRRSSTGSTTSSPPASRRRRCTATTGRCAGCCRWPSRSRSSSPTRATGSSRRGCRSREMVFLTGTRPCDLAEAHSRALPGADLPGRRQRHALERAGRAAPRPGRPPPAARCGSPSSWCGSRPASSAAQGAEDRRRRPLDHDLSRHRRAAGRPPRAVRRAGPRRARVPERRRQPAHRRRASGTTTSRRRRRRPGCTAGSTTCATPASPWPSPRAPTPRRSRPAWATRSINVTLDRYGHLFPELDEAIADAFGRELEGAQQRRRVQRRPRRVSASSATLAANAVLSSVGCVWSR